MTSTRNVADLGSVLTVTNSSVQFSGNIFLANTSPSTGINFGNNYFQKGATTYEKLATIYPTNGVTYIEVALPAEYLQFHFIFQGLVSNGFTGILSAQLSINNGSSWQSAGADYLYYSMGQSFTINGSGGYMVLSYSMSALRGGTAQGLYGRFDLWPATSNSYTYGSSATTGDGANYNPVVVTFSNYVSYYTRPNRIRFFYNGDTFAGRGCIIVSGVTP